MEVTSVNHRAQKRYGLFEGTNTVTISPALFITYDTGRRKKQLEEHIGQQVRRVLGRPVHIINSVVAADLLQRILVPSTSDLCSYCQT
jgi:hypothetical protein